MTKSRLLWFFALAVVVVVGILGLPSTLFAQTTISTGSIQGTITDPSGAIVPSAKIIVANKDTGQTITLTSSSTGTYTSGALIPGNYVVRVENKGFKTAELPVVVQVGVTSSGSIKLELGQESEVGSSRSAGFRSSSEHRASDRPGCFDQPADPGIAH